jgi:predicted ATPase
MADINAFLSGMQILGPFRTPPARRYTFSGLGAADTGISGERAIDLLIMERLLNKSRSGLHKGVSFWLKKLGLASSVEVKDLAKKSNIYELEIRGAGQARAANFADVGYGISQVLPVIVQAFLVPRGGTYIVQQPELHLHPDAQAGLADFFIYLASQGVHSIIETHSEYLLLRIRRRLAEGMRPCRIGLRGESDSAIKEWGKESVAVVYVSEKGKRSTLLPLEIGDAFQFENMPPGFMSQSVDDRMALMKALRT